jgi:hypothetical protein
MEWGMVVLHKVAKMLEDNLKGSKAEGTIFQTMMDSDLPAEGKSVERFQDEGQSVVGAGSETMARTLTVISFYLMQDLSKIQKLRNEL